MSPYSAFLEVVSLGHGMDSRGEKPPPFWGLDLKSASCSLFGAGRLLRAAVLVKGRQVRAARNELWIMLS